MKIKDHNGLLKDVLAIQIERNAQPEYAQNAIYCVYFKDTTFSYFEEGVDVIEVSGDFSTFVKLYNTELMTNALQRVLDTFDHYPDRLVTVQTKQQVLQNIREILERVEHG
ncbi:hypothetical protein SP069_00050 [Salmonella phage SP069]|uniref:Uncharacterized protein n=2 Tax=Nonanavirus TaxID=1921122 RepID=S4TR36_9CAUD|nr:hypothetical protein QII00_sAgp10 [Salmonella phage SP069]AGF89356.1 hypothetical protein SP062_00380 [Salmonella phage FSL SP-062]AGF89509.1 hypothetical protein SP069_00050 [Salmonella phage SP069]ECL8515700.1 hypothetical protein [Salmonella enterica]